MKALSVHPKWAGLIAKGVKTLEVRSKNCRYRGPLLIVSSLRPAHPGVPSGHALCVVDVVGARPMVESDAAAAHVPLVEGHFVWELANVRPLHFPHPVKGSLGLFNVSGDRLPPELRTAQLQPA